MKPRTEEFLYFLLWSAELLSRPSFRNVSQSYEAWAYRNGLLRQVRSLRDQKFVETAPGMDPRIIRLTEQGRLHALGGRDPAIQWTRQWDGRWHLVLFDIPQKHNTRRAQLRRFLKDRFFGCLQGSSWISPDPLEDIPSARKTEFVNAKSLILFEALPCGGENHQHIVKGAWDFVRINACYNEHLKMLEQLPGAPVRDQASAAALQRWATRERIAWLNAMSKDPLLPEELLPDDYLGRPAWRKRVQVLSKAAELIRNFTI